MDLLTYVILLVVDLLVLLRGQMAAVSFPVSVNLLVDVLLVVLHSGGFMRRHLSTADAVSNALLLVCTALIDCSHGHGGWAATVDRSKLSAVSTHGLLMVELVHCGLEVLLVDGDALLFALLRAYA